MNQPDQSPFFVFHDFEDTPKTAIGEGLEKWPLHFTVTPFFTLENVSQEEALATITEVTAEALPIEILPGSEKKYGPNEDIPVTTLIDATGELHHYHRQLIQKLGNLGCRFSDLKYALGDYSPHVSHKPGSPVLLDGRYTASSMSVGTKIQGNKAIVARIEL